MYYNKSSINVTAVCKNENSLSSLDEARIHKRKLDRT